MHQLDALPEEKQQEIQKALHLFAAQNLLPRTIQEAQRRTYKFWSTQPVPKLGMKAATSTTARNTGVLLFTLKLTLCFLTTHFYNLRIQEFVAM